MSKSFNESWGFQEGQVKTYGVTEAQVKYYLEGEAKKDFEAALDGVPDEKRAWASKQAGYHLVAEFMRTHSEPTNKKVDGATYMQLKQQILTDSDLK